MTTVLLFPGQSSRYPGMLQKVCALYPRIAASILRCASDVLGRDVAAEDSGVQRHAALFYGVTRNGLVRSWSP